MATTNAGEMTTTVQGNPQWVMADGKPYYVLDAKQSFRGAVAGTPAKGWRQDYWRRTGRWGRRRGLGPIGWIVLMPYDATATYRVTTASDGGESALVPNVTTTTTASVSPGQTVLPVTSATGFAVGLPIAATGLAAGTTIAAINGLNITLSTPTAFTVSNGATVTVTPAGPPTVMKPPAGIK
jgi:hypothetical protein